MSPTTLMLVSIVALCAALAICLFTVMAWLRSKAVIEHATALVKLADDKSKNAVDIYNQAAARIKVVQDIVSLPALQTAVQRAATDDFEAAGELQRSIVQLQQLSTSTEPDRLMELETQYTQKFQELMTALGVKQNGKGK